MPSTTLYNFGDVVLVALTGYGQDSDRQSSLKAGFDHHLVKPAHSEQLQQILAIVSEALCGAPNSAAVVPDLAHHGIAVDRVAPPA